MDFKDYYKILGVEPTADDKAEWPTLEITEAMQVTER